MYEKEHPTKNWNWPYSLRWPINFFRNCLYWAILFHFLHWKIFILISWDAHVRCCQAFVGCSCGIDIMVGETACLSEVTANTRCNKFQLEMKISNELQTSVMMTWVAFLTYDDSWFRCKWLGSKSNTSLKSHLFDDLDTNDLVWHSFKDLSYQLVSVYNADVPSTIYIGLYLMTLFPLVTL